MAGIHQEGQDRRRTETFEEVVGVVEVFLDPW